MVFRSDANVFHCKDCSHVFSDPLSIEKPEDYGPEYYQDNHRNWFEHPNVPLFAWIASRLSAGTRSVLDVGCGKGDFLRFLRDGAKLPAHLVGVDCSPNESEPGIEYRQGAIAEMPGKEKADAVVCMAVIEHVPDPVAFARLLAARCGPQGIVAVMTVDNDSLLYMAARLMARLGMRTPALRLYSAHHLQHFNVRSLRTALERAGLQLIEVHHHNAPIKAMDFPAPNGFVKAVFTVGVAAIFWLGRATGRTFLQTVLARPVSVQTKVKASCPA
jgi:2-polyprenyl-3-methyl-5-hydroxy-6-metoxy-1,4-benzoquinol methylase